MDNTPFYVEDDSSSLAWLALIPLLAVLIGVFAIALAQPDRPAPAAAATPLPSPTAASPSPKPRPCYAPKVGDPGPARHFANHPNYLSIAAGYVYAPDSPCHTPVRRWVCVDGSGTIVYTTRVPGAPILASREDPSNYVDNVPTWQKKTERQSKALIDACLTPPPPPPPPAPASSGGGGGTYYYGGGGGGGGDDYCNTCGYINRRYNPVCRYSWFC